MFNPCDAILCFYLLMGQRYFVDQAPQFNKPKPWFENKTLITNDNIFDINQLAEPNGGSQEINENP